MRYARTRNLPLAPEIYIKTIERYLPRNYTVTQEESGHLLIEGTDDHGWTLDGYVLPRLASGLHWFEEVTETHKRGLDTRDRVV